MLDVVKIGKITERVLSIVRDERFIVGFYAIVLVISASGFLRVITYSSPPLTPGGTAIALGSEQTGIEFLLTSFSYVMGLAGLYIIYRARRYLFNPRYMLFLLVGGMLLSLLSFLMLNAMYSMKGFT